MMKKIVLICILLMVGRAFSQDKDDNVTIDNLSWLAGHWEGEAFGGTCEEIWNPPSGGTMTGTFKLMHNGRVAFYEMMIITVDSSGPVLKLKHFNEDLTGWEEKDEVITFSFKNYTDNFLELDGISYNRFNDETLLITIEIHKKDGTIAKEEIHCYLKKY